MIKIRERCSSPKTNYLSENNTFKGQQYFGILKTFTSFRQNYIHRRRRGEEGTHESWAMIKTPKKLGRRKSHENRDNKKFSKF